MRDMSSLALKPRRWKKTWRLMVITLSSRTTMCMPWSWVLGSLQWIPGASSPGHHYQQPVAGLGESLWDTCCIDLHGVLKTWPFLQDKPSHHGDITQLSSLVLDHYSTLWKFTSTFLFLLFTSITSFLLPAPAASFTFLPVFRCISSASEYVYACMRIMWIQTWECQRRWAPSLFCGQGNLDGLLLFLYVIHQVRWALYRYVNRYIH